MRFLKYVCEMKHFQWVTNNYFKGYKIYSFIIRGCNIQVLRIILVCYSFIIVWSTWKYLKFWKGDIQTKMYTKNPSKYKIGQLAFCCRKGDKYVKSICLANILCNGVGKQFCIWKDVSPRFFPSSVNHA